MSMLRVYGVILEVVRELRGTVETIERRDSDLGRQMRRALASVVSNTREGSCSRGRNRPARYHDAAGSMQEVRGAIDVAVALGYITSIDDVTAEKLRIAVGTLVKGSDHGGKRSSHATDSPVLHCRTPRPLLRIFGSNAGRDVRSARLQ
jgi:four helix bundle protein